MSVSAGQQISKADLDALAAKANAKLQGGPYRFFGRWFLIPGIDALTELQALKDVDIGDVAIPAKKNNGIGGWQLAAYPSATSANWKALATSFLGWFGNAIDLTTGPHSPYAVAIDEYAQAFPFDPALPAILGNGYTGQLFGGVNQLRTRGLYTYRADLVGINEASGGSRSSTGWVPIGSRLNELNRMRAYAAIQSISLVTAYATIPAPTLSQPVPNHGLNPPPKLARVPIRFAFGGPSPISDSLFPALGYPRHTLGRFYYQGSSGGTIAWTIRPILGVDRRTNPPYTGIRITSSVPVRIKGTLWCPTSVFVDNTILGDTTFVASSRIVPGHFASTTVQVFIDGVLPAGTHELAWAQAGGNMLRYGPGAVDPQYQAPGLLCTAEGPAAQSNGLATKPIWSAAFLDIPFSGQFSRAQYNQPVNDDDQYYLLLPGTGQVYNPDRYLIPVQSSDPTNEELGISGFTITLDDNSAPTNHLLLAKTFPVIADEIPFAPDVFNRVFAPKTFAPDTDDPVASDPLLLVERLKKQDLPAVPYPCAMLPNKAAAAFTLAPFAISFGLTEVVFRGCIKKITISRLPIDGKFPAISGPLNFQIGAFGILGQTASVFVQLFAGTLAANQNFRTWKDGESGFGAFPVLSPVPLAYRCAETLIIQAFFEPAYSAPNYISDGAIHYSSYSARKFVRTGSLFNTGSFEPENADGLGENRAPLQAIHYNEIESWLNALP